MLNAKNGVITEERFQRLTEVQWLFHYMEVTKFRGYDNKDKIDFTISLLDILDERLKVLLDTIMESNKLAGMISNPKMGKEIIERERLEKDRALIKDDDFAAWWEDYSQFLPDDLEVIAVGDDVDLEGGGIDLERMNEFYADEIERNISESKGGENND